MQGVVYFVEATNFEQQALLDLNNAGGAIMALSSRAVSHTVGESQTSVQFRMGKVYGHPVCFYHPTSARVDWNDVETYIKRYNRPRCNAENFNDCVDYCRSKR